MSKWIPSDRPFDSWFREMSRCTLRVRLNRGVYEWSKWQDRVLVEFGRRV